MSKNNTTVRKLKMSDYERRAMALFDRDLSQRFPEIDIHAPALRVGLVREAMAAVPSRFKLCRDVARLARMVHDSNTRRVPNTLNDVLRLLAGTTTQKKAPATGDSSKPAAREAAA